MSRNHLLAFSLYMAVTFSLMYSIHKGKEATDSLSDMGSDVQDNSSKVDDLESDLEAVKSEVESLE